MMNRYSLFRWLGVISIFLTSGITSAATVDSDFNGDGFDDLAIGIPFENDYRGGVSILYGSRSGLVAARNQFWNENSTGIAGESKTGDQFGYSIASGDFDKNGYDDLAIGIIGKTIDSMPQAGAVKIIYGSPKGLIAARNQSWNQNSPGIQDSAEENDFFGRSLATGDFDCDGYDDLAIGVWLEDIDESSDAGGIHVLFGSANGLTSKQNQFWHQNSNGIQDASEFGDQMGYSMKSGDFDSDGCDDIAIGAIGEAIAARSDAGAVNIIYGSSTGLTSKRNQFWSQNSVGILENSESGDQFASSLTAEDFDGDGFDDLAIGVPREIVHGFLNAGAVHVLYGTRSGLKSIGNQLWHQDVRGMSDVCDEGDGFGTSLAAGDFNNDGFRDLAIGVVFENLDSITDAGAVSIVFGSAGGLSAGGNQLLSQNFAPGLDPPEPGDSFGASLSVRDFDQNGFADLAVGVPLEDIGNITDAGAVHVLYNFKGTATFTNRRIWHQNAGIKNACAIFDHFGLALDNTTPSSLIE